MALLMLLALSLSGCGNEEQDPFFSQPREEWSETAKTLPTKEVYRLYKVMLDRPPPPDTSLAAALGAKGRAAVIVWIEDVEKTGDVVNTWEFRPILNEVRQQTGYSICDDETIHARAVDALVMRWGSNRNGGVEAMLAPTCE